MGAGVIRFVLMGLLWVQLASAQLSPKYDSAHTIALDANITDGVLITTSRPARFRREIQEQLRYAIGFFNHLRSGPRLSLAQISINRQQSVVTAQGGAVTEVHYSAQFLVAWDRERTIPGDLNLILPAGGTTQALAAFYDAYHAICNDEVGRRRAPTDGAASRVDRNNFWYHYRPHVSGCPLASSQWDTQANELARRVNVRFAVSDQNTEARFPEYSEIWRDGELTLTIIAGKEEEGATDPRTDRGVAAYNEIYNALLRQLGTPGLVSPVFEGAPGVANSQVELLFNVEQGRVKIHLELVDNLFGLDAEARERIAAAMRISDVVMYNGHAGLGANVRALQRMARFDAGRYQIYVINGCDTFSYADTRLHNAVARANPGANPTKYLDVILNAMPSYFVRFDENQQAMIQSLLGRMRSYRQILSRFDPAQRALVVGEEDNGWPMADF